MEQRKQSEAEEEGQTTVEGQGAVSSSKTFDSKETKEQVTLSAEQISSLTVNKQGSEEIEASTRDMHVHVDHKDVTRDADEKPEMDHQCLVGLENIDIDDEQETVDTEIHAQIQGTLVEEVKASDEEFRHMDIDHEAEGLQETGQQVDVGTESVPGEKEVVSPSQSPVIFEMQEIADGQDNGDFGEQVVSSLDDSQQPQQEYTTTPDDIIVVTGEEVSGNVDDDRVQATSQHILVEAVPVVLSTSNDFQQQQQIISTGDAGVKVSSHLDDEGVQAIGQHIPGAENIETDDKTAVEMNAGDEIHARIQSQSPVIFQVNDPIDGQSVLTTEQTCLTTDEGHDQVQDASIENVETAVGYLDHTVSRVEYSKHGDIRGFVASVESDLELIIASDGADGSQVEVESSLMNDSEEVHTSAVEETAFTPVSHYCQQCDRFFASKEHLDKHNTVGRHFCRNDDGVYVCRYCKKDFNSIGGVIYHESICGKTFTAELGIGNQVVVEPQQKEIENNAVESSSSEDPESSSSDPESDDDDHGVSSIDSSDSISEGGDTSSSDDSSSSDSDSDSEITSSDARKSKSDSFANTTASDGPSGGKRRRRKNSPRAYSMTSDETSGSKKGRRKDGSPRRNKRSKSQVSAAIIDGTANAITSVDSSDGKKGQKTGSPRGKRHDSAMSSAGETQTKGLPSGEGKAGRRSLYCTYCNIRKPNYKLIRMHEQKKCELRPGQSQEGVLRGDKKEQVRRKNARRMYACRYCKTELPTLSTIRRHEKSQCRNAPSASVVSAAVSSDTDRTANKKKRRQNASNVDAAAAQETTTHLKNDITNYCKTCCRGFSNARLFNKHMKAGLHLNSNGCYACNMCDEEFEVVGSLQTHLLDHIATEEQHLIRRRKPKQQDLEDVTEMPGKSLPGRRSTRSERKSSPVSSIQDMDVTDASGATTHDSQAKNPRTTARGPLAGQSIARAKKMAGQSPVASRKEETSSKRSKVNKSDLKSTHQPTTQDTRKRVAPGSTEMQDHRVMTSKLNALRCKHCRVIIRFRSLLEKHQNLCKRFTKREIGKTDVDAAAPMKPTTLCGKTDKRRKGLLAGMARQNRFRCNSCNMVVRLKSLLDKHESACLHAKTVEHRKREAEASKLAQKKVTPVRRAKPDITEEAIVRTSAPSKSKPGSSHCKFCNVFIRFKGLLKKHESACQHYKTNVKEKVAKSPKAQTTPERGMKQNTDGSTIKTSASPKPGMLRCRFCNVVIKFKSLLAKHESICHLYKQDMSTTCELCNKVFKSKNGVKQHLLWCKKKASAKRDKSITGGNKRKSFTKLRAPGFCPACNRVFLSIDQHLKEQHNFNEQGRFCCKFCKNEYPTIDMIADHERTCPSKAGVEFRADLKSKYCLQCEKVFFTSAEYEAHMAAGRHKNIKGRFPCKYCRQEFQQEKGLIIHEARVHPKSEDERLVTTPSDKSCKLCSKSFPTRYKLKKHMETKHGSDGTLLCCRFCNKTFTDPGLVKGHEVNDCTEKYTYAGASTEDQGVRKEVCDDTVEEPSQEQRRDEMSDDANSGADSHEATTCQQNEFLCKDCERLFPNQLEYECHMEAGHHKKPNGLYSCTFCKLPFEKMSGLLDHEKQHVSESFISTGGESSFPTSSDVRMRQDSGSSPTATLGSPSKSANGEKQTNKGSKKRVDNADSSAVVQLGIKSEFKCNTCQRGFQDEAEYQYHMDAGFHNTDGAFTCAFCRRPFENMQTLMSHISGYHYDDGGADPSFGSGNQQQSATADTDVPTVADATSGQDKPGQGTSASNQVVDQDNLNSGGAVTKGLRKRLSSLSCQYCHKGFAWRANLLKHERDDHPHSVAEKPGNTLDASSPRSTAKAQHARKGEESESTAKEIAKYYCVFGCSPPLEKTFPSRESLWFHAMNDHKDTSNQCVVCKINFSSWGKANKHIEDKHQIGKELQNQLEVDGGSQIQYLCVFGCEYQSFSSLNDLASHASAEHKNFSRLCSHCNLAFSSPAEASQHVGGTHVIGLSEKDKQQRSANQKAQKKLADKEALSERYLCTFGCEMKLFGLLLDLESHASAIHPDCKECLLCGINFGNTDLLVQHIGRCHKIKCYFPVYPDVTGDAERGKKPNNFTVEDHLLCTYGCNMKTFLRSSFLEHIQEVHDGKKYNACLVCELDNTTLDHIFSFHTVKVCKKVGPRSPLPNSRDSFDARTPPLKGATPGHSSEHVEPSLHNSSLPALNTATTSHQMHRCIFGCRDKSFPSYKDLLSHIRVRHCLFCKLTFGNFDDARIHARVVHKTELTNDSPEKLGNDAVVDQISHDGQQGLQIKIEGEPRRIIDDGSLRSPVDQGSGHSRSKSPLSAKNRSQATSFFNCPTCGLRFINSRQKNDHVRSGICVTKLMNKKGMVKSRNEIFQKTTKEGPWTMMAGRKRPSETTIMHDETNKGKASVNSGVGKNATLRCKHCNVIIRFKSLLMKHENVCQHFKKTEAQKCDNHELAAFDKSPREPLEHSITQSASKTSESPKLLRCKFCRVAIRFKNLLAKHESACQQLKKTENKQQDVCKSSTTAKSKTPDKQAKQSNQTVTRISGSSPKHGKLRCQFCNVTIRLKSLLDKHERACQRLIKTVTNDPPVHASPETPKTPGKKGKQTIHDEGTKPSGSPKQGQLRCQYCNITIRLKSLLEKHESACKRLKETGRPSGKRKGALMSDTAATKTNTENVDCDDITICKNSPSPSKKLKASYEKAGPPPDKSPSSKRTPSSRRSQPSPVPDDVSSGKTPDEPVAQKVCYEEHFLCTFGCEMTTFAKFADLKLHAQDLHGDDQKCVPCKEELDTFSAVLDHIKEKHKIFCMVVD